MRNYFYLIFQAQIILGQLQDIPEYLALVANASTIQYQMDQFAFNHMKELRSNFPLDQDLNRDFMLIQDKFHGMQNQWIDASPWHVTCLYIGDNYTKLETEYYTSFKENKIIPIDIPAFVYVPNKLQIGVAFVDQRLVLIENQCQHMTLFREEWPAVNSNYVLESLFLNDGQFKDVYPHIIQNDNQLRIISKLVDIQIDEEIVNVYLSKIPNYKLQLIGITKKMMD